MRPVSSVRHVCSFIAGALALGAFACAPAKPAPTTLTAADMSKPSTREAAPAPAAAGQLVCRAKSSSEGTTELFLDWQGSSAKGSLRRVAPSGNLHDQTVRAERYNGMIVADDIWETDLVAHAATVREQSGKKYIRLGDNKQPWMACE